MAIGEFKLIETYFAAADGGRKDVVLGVGDDAALVQIPSGHELVVATDTLVEGVHFPEDFPAAAIGHRALAVNLSDMAAMGAAPAWCTLALTLPAAREDWLADFSRGLLELAAQHGVALIGGDTTSGPLTITVQILGLVPAGIALRRSGARPDDVVCVSGTPGDASAGLALLTGKQRSNSPQDREYLIDRFVRPLPRIQLGLMLRGIATSAIDVSDGLYADLAKLMSASSTGAHLDLDTLPLSPQLLRCAGQEAARNYAMQGGDDYELCFTVPPDRLPELRSATKAAGQVIHSIGFVEERQSVRCFLSGQPFDQKFTGYDHFLNN